METETLPPPHMSILSHITDDALQDIVQWAYDQRGILAQPSYDTEVELSSSTIRDRIAAAHNQGVRA